MPSDSDETASLGRVVPRTRATASISCLTVTMMVRQNATSVPNNTPVGQVDPSPTPRFLVLWNMMLVLLRNTPSVDQSGTVQSGVPQAVAEKMCNLIDTEFAEEWADFSAKERKEMVKKKVAEFAGLAQRVSNKHTPLKSNVTSTFLTFHANYQARTATKHDDERTTRALCWEKRVCT